MTPSSSLINYDGKVFDGLPAPAAAAGMVRKATPSVVVILGLWAFFVTNRALHPLLIELSKGEDGKMPYEKLSPVIAKCFASVIICNLLAMALDKDGWKAGLRKCYNMESLPVFARIGVLYAMGDYLEMMSMSSMDGAAYQVMLQSKLMITALLMWAIKGHSARQSPAQWCVLVNVTLGMSLFMLIQTKGPSGSKSSGFTGTFFVLAKVFVSCYCAVKADASLKKFAHLPLYAQLSQLMGTWGVVSVVMATILEPSAVSSPAAFFRGWDGWTVLVMLSFAAKTVLTMTLLKVLDSVLKNIGEAVAVLVIYFAQVTLPIFPQKFEVNTFMAMMVVVMGVSTYILLKQESSKSKELPEARICPDAKAKPRSPKSSIA